VPISLRVSRRVQHLLAAVLALGTLLALAGVAGAADVGRLYWATGANSVIGTATIAQPGVVTSFAANGQPNGVFASSSNLYWTTQDTRQIVIANLAGQIQGAISPGTTPTGVVAVGEYLYWSDNGYIGRASASGAPAQTGWLWYATPGMTNTAVWADPNYLYWAGTTSTGSTIGRIALNGSSANPAFVSNTVIPNAVVNPTAITADGARIYWVNQNASMISAANVASGLQITQDYLDLPGQQAIGLAETGNGFYWTNTSGTYIGLASLAPAVTNSQFVNTLAAATDIAVSRYALTTTKAGAGAGTVSSATPASTVGINCGPVCTSDYPDMAAVTLTATPATGSVFSGWTGACTGTARTCTVTMSQSQSVQATFVPAVTNFVLTLTRSGRAAGSIVSSPVGLNCGTVCAAPFAKNTKVTLTAVEGPLSDFAGWGGACSGFKLQGTCTVTMSQARAASATFNPAPVLTLTKFGITNATFRVGGHTTAVRAYTPIGTTIKYTLAENANVTVAFQRVGYAKKQYLYRSSGAKGGKTGANAISFTGRIGRTPLAPGRWKVIITASDGTTTTKAQLKYFTIKS
jgi:hypothetical protein